MTWRGRRRSTWALLAWGAYVLLVVLVVLHEHRRHVTSQCRAACRQVLDVVEGSIFAEVLAFGIFGLGVLGVLALVTGWWGGRRRRASGRESA